MTRAGVRWGRWRMSGPVLEMVKNAAFGGEWDGVAGLLEFNGRTIVMRANDHVADDCIEYWGVSPLFDPVEEGAEIPLYEVHFNTVQYCADCGAEDVWDTEDGYRCRLCESALVRHRSKFVRVERIENRQ